MSIADLRKRLNRLVARGLPERGFGHGPVISLVTRDDEDFAAQLATLEAAGEYTPSQFVIDRRIVTPDLRMKAEHQAWQQGRLGGGPLQ